MQIPSAHWNHNSHYYEYLLAKVPPRCLSALDIGCGTGHFAAGLSAICTYVEGIDSDQNAIDFAKRTFGSIGNITFICKRFQDCDLPDSRYGFISLIAVLHHMELEGVLKRIKEILAPGGVVAILGCFKEATVSDLLRAVMAAPINLIFKWVNRTSNTGTGIKMVTTEAKESLKQIRKTMNEFLPNHQYKRHLFWRYSIVWQKPTP